MKKVIRLTESDLVKIVNKVIEEQKITDKGPIINKDTIIKIDDNDLIKKYNFNKEEKAEDFLSKLKNSPVGINAFHIESEGWRFPIEPVYLNTKLKDVKLRLSFEPFNRQNGKYMFRLTKSF
jgi:hypothetical protein